MEDWAPYGIGEPDADGYYQSYRTPPKHLRPQREEPKKWAPTWRWPDLLTRWDMIAADLESHYGIDPYTQEFWATPWPINRNRVEQLLTDPHTRTHRVLIAPQIAARQEEARDGQHVM